MQFLTYLLIPSIVSALAIKARTEECDSSKQLRALYTLNGDPAGAEVLAFKINQDGTLSDEVSNPSGGLGSFSYLHILTNLSAPSPLANDDPLESQHAIIVHNDYLFNVNTGSNSLTMWTIDPRDPYHLRKVNTVSSLGTFPMSIAYSAALKQACVLNGGDKAGIACFSVDHAKGLKAVTPLLPIKITQSAPIVGPFNTTSQIDFSPNGEYLMATVKGPSFTGEGFFQIHRIVDGKVNASPIIKPASKLLLPFAFQWLNDTRVIVTDLAGAWAVYNFDAEFNPTLETMTRPADGLGLCWAIYSKRFNTVVLSGAFSPNIRLIDPVTGLQKGQISQTPVGGDSLDSVVDREYAYFLQLGKTISVNKLTGLNSIKGTNFTLDSQFQTFQISSPSDRKGFTGLASYPSSL